MRYQASVVWYVTHENTAALSSREAIRINLWWCFQDNFIFNHQRMTETIIIRIGLKDNCDNCGNCSYWTQIIQQQHHINVEFCSFGTTIIPEAMIIRTIIRQKWWKLRSNRKISSLSVGIFPGVRSFWHELREMWFRTDIWLKPRLGDCTFWGQATVQWPKRSFP
jgi:hypothetical protein